MKHPSILKIMRRFFAPALLAGLAACSFFSAGRESGFPRLPDDRYRWVADGLEIMGEGKPDPSLLVESQRRSSSRDAAVIDALGRLKAYEAQIVVPEKGPIGKLAAADPAWEARLKKTVDAIEIRGTNWEYDDNANVIIWVSRGALDGLKHPEPAP